MMTIIQKEWKMVQDWLQNNQRDTPARGEPLFPMLTVGLIFFAIPSFHLGHTLPWIVFPLAVLLNFKWWAGHLWHSDFLRHPLRLYLWLILVWVILSASFSPDPTASWWVFWRVLFLAWLGFGLISLLRHVAVERWYSWLIWIMCLYCFFGYLHLGLQELGWLPRRGASFNTWVLMLFMPFLIHRFRQGKDRVLILVSLLYPLLSSYYYENRSTVIAILAIVVLVFWFERRRLGRWLVPILAFSVVAAIFIATYFFQTKFTIYSQMSGEIFAPPWLIDPLRQVTWNYVWHLLPDIPLFGFGPDTGRLAPGADEVGHLSAAPYYKAMGSTPHNVFLQWIVELGWLGFFLILGLYVLRFYRLLREKDPIYQYEWMIHGVFFGISFFNTNFWREWWSPPYFFALFILHALAQGLRKKGAT